MKQKSDKYEIYKKRSSMDINYKIYYSCQDEIKSTYQPLIYFYITLSELLFQNMSFCSNILILIFGNFRSFQYIIMVKQQLDVINIEFIEEKRIMQQELQEIIKRFQSDYYHNQYQNTDIVKYYDDEDNHQFCNQEIIKLKNKTNLMEQTIESLVYYGNRTHKFYQTVINQTINNFNVLKEQKNQREQLYTLQIKEAKRIIDQLGKNIQIMKRQIHNKQDNYKEICQKYQQLIERSNQAHQEYQRHLKDIQTSFKQEMEDSKRIIQTKEHLLIQYIQQNKKFTKEIMELKDQNKLAKAQNCNLSKENCTLLKQKEVFLSQKQQISKKLNSLQQKLDDMLLLNQQFGGEQNHNYIRTQQRCKTIRTNRSRDMIIPEQKETLDISEHYIQSIKSFQIKFDQSQEHIEEIIVKRSRFAKHSRFKTAFINIQQEDLQKKTEKPIQQAQQTTTAIVKNPYQSFFSLLVQSQKLNSSHFNQIAALKLNHLYDQFIKNLIPFNKWQPEIKKYLESKLSQKSKIK